MAFIEIKSNIDSFINNFTKEFRPAIKRDVIQNGLDNKLSEDLEILKSAINDILEERNYNSKSEINVEQEVDEVNLKNTDVAWLKYLTGSDLDKYNSAKDYATALDSKVAIINYYRAASASPSDSIRMGVKLRLETNSSDTIENSFASAISYFNSSVFIFVDSSGTEKYMMNPGFNMTNFIKVVCSTDTGITSYTIRSGTQKKSGSVERFETHKSERGYADWSLNAEGIAFIKNNFIDLTPIINNLKNNDVEEALNMLQMGSAAKSVGPNVEDLQDKIVQARDSKNLTYDTRIFSNIKSLISNLKISKRTNTIGDSASTLYALISGYEEDTSEEFLNFFEKFERELSLWKITNEKPWVSALINKITETAIKTIEKINV